MAYQILEGCIMCGACKEECRFGAITERKDKRAYAIEPEKCVECDQCADVCPADLVKRDPSTPSRKRFSVIRIKPDDCIGCSLCARVCPVKAISGEIKHPFVIDENRCIKCGVCLTKCKKNAFDVTYIE